ncbi:hypothetical protein RCO27_06180 [Sphingosinicella sp. LHD-64]|uniref:hypothetical protein n=1 Tax=Sphingosinicella sp. LHD-64 TaxID=3072139 RepID=UPI00281006AC|nr:hypothetical protein [Sphingosinicella sp. LHD-64]MDQ8755812.1 hypothetical protein [Sphingosinicella sp. LHD-64]
MRHATSDPAVLDRQSRSLSNAEQAFSDNAQRIGIGPAFREAGAPDAMNMGAGAGFTIGNAAIGELVASSEPGSPVSGMIRSNGPVPEGRPTAAPMFIASGAGLRRTGRGAILPSERPEQAG